MLKIGSHMDMKAPDYLLGAIQKTIENEATALMVYTGAPQNTVRKSVSTFHIPEAHSLMQEA
ncbi:MAG: deoxyribonuclease IV, partial [Erysipelotrichales bacterium]|nr:deoxyribonuclease IV [Erysipelotrichales bacterium]